MAPTLEWLVAGRVVQGLGAAATMAVRPRMRLRWKASSSTRMGRAAITVPAITTLSSSTWPAERDFKRSEEHTSELQSLMRISYAVFCLKKKKKTQETMK